jgi:AraC-like DNA-binding protein
MLKKPITRLWQARSRWSSCVYAYASRNTIACELQGKERENRFPATPFVTICWFLIGSVELVSGDVKAPEGPLPSCLINGRQGPIISRNQGDLLYFGLSMYPDAFTAAFGMSPQAVEGQLLDAYDVLPSYATELLDAVRQASCDEDRMALFESFLEVRVKDFKVSLWESVLRAGSRISVQLLSGLLRVGQRQAIRATQNTLGVKVAELKRFARGEVAFSEFNDRLKASEPVSLADIAAQAGYADQAHLSRDCKAVTGRTPSEFVREFREDEANWIYRIFPSSRRDR